VTLGLGVAYKPDFWQGAGRPLSVFLEINHSWWQNAHFDTPPNSTAFNYTFPRNDTTLKTGIMIALGGQRVR
jgi:hypothetical protein